uniref:Uncharacterized protein n=1 Tax=Rhizophora mucronata TaxID=61149 RepID=A0A2P2ME77_RHIMU
MKLFAFFLIVASVVQSKARIKI